MKKLLILLAVVGLMAVGCTPEPEPTTPQPSIEIVSGADNATLDFTDKFGSKTVTFKANLDWTATASESWVNIPTSKGKAGDNCKITVKVQGNTTNEPRQAKVTISVEGYSVELNVVQAQNNSLVVSPSNVKLEAVGGNFTVEVSANVEFTATLSDGCDWISAVDNRAITDTTLTYAATENTSTESRTATITISGEGLTETVTVTQKGQEVVVPETELTILTPSVEVEAAGGSFAIEVSANVEYTVAVTEGADWLSHTSDLNFTATENTSTESRTATITVSGGDKTATLTVTQKGQEVVVPETELTILTPSVEVEAAGGSFAIEVSANVEYTVAVTEGADWLSHTSDLNFTATENTSTESRTATITVSGGDKTATLTVTQKGKEVVPTPPASDDDMTLDDIPVVPGDWA